MNQLLRCRLSPREREKRRRRIQATLWTDDVQIRVEDGRVSLTYPGDAKREEALLRFVRAERACCPFFDVELSWARGDGPVTLSLAHEDITEEDWRSFGVLPA